MIRLWSLILINDHLVIKSERHLCLRIISSTLIMIMGWSRRNLKDQSLTEEPQFDDYWGWHLVKKLKKKNNSLDFIRFMMKSNVTIEIRISRIWFWIGDFQLLCIYFELIIWDVRTTIRYGRDWMKTCFLSSFIFYFFDSLFNWKKKEKPGKFLKIKVLGENNFNSVPFCIGLWLVNQSLRWRKIWLCTE